MSSYSTHTQTQYPRESNDESLGIYIVCCRIFIVCCKTYIDRVTYRPMYQKRRTKESFSVHFESLPLQIHHQRPYNISLTSYDMNVELFLLPILLKHLLEAFRPQLLIVVGEPLEKRKWIFDDRFLVQSHRRRIRNCAWNRSLSPMLNKKEK